MLTETQNPDVKSEFLLLQEKLALEITDLEKIPISERSPLWEKDTAVAKTAYAVVPLAERLIRLVKDYKVLFDQKENKFTQPIAVEHHNFRNRVISLVNKELTISLIGPTNVGKHYTVSKKIIDALVGKSKLLSTVTNPRVCPTSVYALTLFPVKYVHSEKISLKIPAPLRLLLEEMIEEICSLPEGFQSKDSHMHTTFMNIRKPEKYICILNFI